MKKVFLEKRLLYKVLIVLSSFGLGVLIYLLFRSRKLFYYQFIEMLNLDPYLIEVRKIVWVYRKHIPNWVIYSLPDGLWIFSMGVSILHNRYYYKRAQNIFNIVLSSIIATEVIQSLYGGHGTFVGTFDIADVICYIIGYLLSSLLGYFNWKKNYKNKEILKKNEILKKERKKILIIIVIFTILGFLPALIK
ncbi:MAG: hypothetical protein ACRC5W_00640 [Cetobacterium sp.]|uniref:hypothetical protein n=1 Tax=Cetobacterium sp. TaxID=2071632 RepID=UPI003F3FA20F